MFEIANRRPKAGAKSRWSARILAARRAQIQILRTAQRSLESAEKTFEIKTQRKGVADLANFKTTFLCIAAPVLLWGCAVWAATAYGNAASARDTATQTPTAVETLSQAGERDFVSARARLDSALAHHEKQNAQAILRRVRDENATRGIRVCSFEWGQGQVSLVHGQDTGQPMGRDMSNCAEAVEKDESSQ
jgi:hypothetical protein